MRKGQRNARRNDPFYKKAHRKVAPHHYLEQELIQLEKLNSSVREVWKDFQKYLAEEREKVLDHIKHALVKSSSFGFSHNRLGRIIGSNFSSTPLSCKGSYHLPPGGRFNFGKSISYQNYFPALYVASDYNVAYCEKFRMKNEEKSTISSEEFALQQPNSFSHQRIKVFLERVIDLRGHAPIDAFFEEIKHLHMPEIYQKRFEELNENISVIDNSTQLGKSIMESNYEQWDYWIDCPSNSQWFGHYVRLAGIQGIIYPSVRMASGFNIVIFPDKFLDGNSYVELVDECDFVSPEQRRIDSSNFNLFL